MIHKWYGKSQKIYVVHEELAKPHNVKIAIIQLLTMLQDTFCYPWELFIWGRAWNSHVKTWVYANYHSSEKGKFTHIFSSHFPFFWEIQMHFFSLSLSLFLSSSLYGRKERKVGLKCRLVLTHIWLRNERQISAMCWAETYIRSSLATFSRIFSLEANGWKIAEPKVSGSDGNLGMESSLKPSDCTGFMEIARN